jgi:hypothetical protein
MGYTVTFQGTSQITACAREKENPEAKELMICEVPFSVLATLKFQDASRIIALSETESKTADFEKQDGVVGVLYIGYAG